MLGLSTWMRVVSLGGPIACLWLRRLPTPPWGDLGLRFGAEGFESWVIIIHSSEKA